MFGSFWNPTSLLPGESALRSAQPAGGLVPAGAAGHSQGRFEEDHSPCHEPEPLKPQLKAACGGKKTRGASQGLP